MVKVICVHSSRGGTGKTLIALNMAATYASEGKSVALLDMDFRAPSLYTVFEAAKRQLITSWTNDFLDCRTSVRDILVDVSDEYELKGKLLVGFADPSIDAIRQYSEKGRKWQMRALRKMLELKRDLGDLDRVVVDTSPGVHYSSVNAVVSSDLSVVVATMDELDVAGVRRMLAELYDAFDKDTAIILNKVTPYMLFSEEERKRTLSRIERMFDKPVVGVIPCYCDVLLASRLKIFALERPEHPFARAIRDIVRGVDRLLGG